MNPVLKVYSCLTMKYVIYLRSIKYNLNGVDRLMPFSYQLLKLFAEEMLKIKASKKICHANGATNSYKDFSKMKPRQV